MLTVYHNGRIVNPSKYSNIHFNWKILFNLFDKISSFTFTIYLGTTKPPFIILVNVFDSTFEPVKRENSISKPLIS